MSDESEARLNKNLPAPDSCPKCKNEGWVRDTWTRAERRRDEREHRGRRWCPLEKQRLRYAKKGCTWSIKDLVTAGVIALGEDPGLA